MQHSPSPPPTTTAETSSTQEKATEKWAFSSAKMCSIPIQTMDGTARPLMAFQTKKKDVLHKRSPQTAVMIIYDY